MDTLYWNDVDRIEEERQQEEETFRSLVYADVDDDNNRIFRCRKTGKIMTFLTTDSYLVKIHTEVLSHRKNGTRAEDFMVDVGDITSQRAEFQDDIMTGFCYLRHRGYSRFDMFTAMHCGAALRHGDYHEVVKQETDAFYCDQQFFDPNSAT